MTAAIDTNLIYRALIITGLIAFGFYLAADRGLVTLALTSDKSYISYVILGIYLIASVHWLWLSRLLTRERAQFARLERSDDGAPTPAEGLLGEFFERLQSKNTLDATALLGAFGDELTNRHALGHFTSEALLKLGLLGTIVGFILMLLPVGEIEEFDPALMQKLLSSMGAGMAVALFTTLAGLITSTLLKLQYHMVDAAAADLATRLQVYVDLHVDAANGNDDTVHAP